MRELLTHPLTLVGSAIGLLAQFAGFLDPAWTLLSSTSGVWFPAIAVTAGTILPEIGLEAIGTQILVSAAVVFVLVKLDKLADRIREHFNK